MSAILKAKVLSSLLQKSLPAAAAMSTSTFKPESLALTLGTVPANIVRKLDSINSRNDLRLSNFGARSSLPFAKNPALVTKSSISGNNIIGNIKCVKGCDPTKLGEGDYCGYCG
jgi:hypothetical protein